MKNRRQLHWQLVLLAVSVTLLAAAAGRSPGNGEAAAGDQASVERQSLAATKSLAALEGVQLASLPPIELETQIAQTADETNLLLFQAGTIDTSAQISRPLAEASWDGEALHIIQFTGPIQDSWLSAVEATGAQLVHYVANNGYLVWADGSSRSELDRLANSSRFLQFSAPYSANLKADRSLHQMQTASSSGAEIAVIIQMLRHNGQSQTEKLIEALVTEPLGDWAPVLNYQNMRAVVSSSSLETIAALPDVVWIEPYQAPEKMDEKQAQILAGNLNSSQSAPNGPGYLQWLKDLGFSDDPQMYPIIDITDDGIGTGIASTAAGDQTFRAAGEDDGPSRIAYIKNCTDALTASGPDGHGHINASIAGGFDTRSGGPYQDEDGYQRGMGINPFGRLAGTRVFNGPSFDLSNCDNSLVSLVKQSYRSGARIVNNSWGCAKCGYNSSSQIYDAVVRDADNIVPGNQEMLILFSAGNSGLEGLGSPANGKNVITVGASENVRPTWIDGCGFGPIHADDAQDIASYSSRGPAQGGRVKPDIVAPGTHIIGTASTAFGYNGSAICDKYQPDDQQIFAASTGTSHSVPAVAGLASLSSYWLTEKYGMEKPSPALLKAYLVAASSHLTGNGANDTLPSFNQGYGLPNMTHAFDATARIIVEQGETPQFNESGQSWSMKVRQFDGEKPLRIVMVFTDEPGLLSAGDPRVNNLDLVVQKNGVTYLGNEMSGQWSRPGGEADMVNTVEAVFLPPDELSAIDVVVKASNIVGDGVPGNRDITDQDFALVCDNCQVFEYEFHSYIPVNAP